MTPINNKSETNFFTDDRPMGRGQIMAILLVILVAILDGYDLIAMALVAPVVSAEWSIGKAQLGLLLAGSLVGMAAGSLLLAPQADRFGRRPLVLFSLALATVGTLISGMSHGITELLASRVVTGIGLGALVPLLATAASEYANARSRSFVVACSSIGLPLGGALGGIVAALLLKQHHWHWVFLSGTIAGAIMFVVAFLVMPESPAFLVARRPKDALERLNRVLVRWGYAPLASLPQAGAPAENSYRVLFAPALRPETLRLAGVNVLMVVAGYYMMNWAPQIIAGEGFTASTASMVSSTASLIGFSGPLVFGALATRFAPTRLAVFTMLCFAAALAALGMVPPALSLLITTVSVCAVCMSATAALFSAIVVQTFPANVRASAIGVTMGIGRVASGLGPYLAGLMFGAGWSRAHVSLSFATLAVGAAILMSLVRRQPKPASA